MTRPRFARTQIVLLIAAVLAAEVVGGLVIFQHRPALGLAVAVMLLAGSATSYLLGIGTKITTARQSPEI